MIPAMFLIAAVVAFVTFFLGREEGERRIRVKYHLIPNNDLWPEFALSVEELADLYTLDQLVRMRDAISMGRYSDPPMRVVFGEAAALRKVRDIANSKEEVQ